MSSFGYKITVLLVEKPTGAFGAPTLAELRIPDIG